MIILLDIVDCLCYYFNSTLMFLMLRGVDMFGAWILIAFVAGVFALFIVAAVRDNKRKQTNTGSSGNVSQSSQNAVKQYSGGKSIAIVFIGIVVFLSIFVALFSCNCSKNTVEDETCSVCGRTFNWDSDNAKSIRKHHMCTNCYNNYKWAREQPIG